MEIKLSNPTSYITVDTSVFISACAESEVNCQESKKLFNFIKDENIFVILPINILFEVINNLFKIGIDDKIVYQFFGDSPNVGLIPLDEEFLEKVWVYYQNFNKLKTADRILAVTSYFFHTPLITWDNKIIRDSSEYCQAMTPKEFMKKPC